MKVFLGILLALAALIGLYFAYNYFFISPELISPRQPTTQKELVIGWIGPLTGPAEVLGKENLNALKMAIEDYHNKKPKGKPKVKLIIADDQYKADLTEKEYAKMIADDHPLVIFVTTYSGLKKIAGEAVKDKVIIIDSIDNDAVLSSLSKNVFLIAKETEELAGIEANILVNQSKKNVVVLYNNSDEFMVNLAQTLKQVLQVTGIKTELIGYEQNNPNFKAFFESDKSKKFDAYVFFGYTEVGNGMKLARKSGITAPFYSINVITDPVLQANAEGTTEGTYLAHFTAEDGNRPHSLDFIKLYEKKYGERPKTEWTALQTFDAATILFNIVKTNETPDITDEQIQNAFLKVSNFEGVSGKISIKPNGSSRGIYPKLYVLKNGVPVPVETK